MPAKTSPAHGTRACYLRGCRRPECGDAHYRYMARYRLDRHRGNTRRINVNATPALERTNQLLAAGWNHRQIAEAAGTSRRAISDLVTGKLEAIHQDTARGILAVPVGPAPAPRQYTEATGTMRRLRALVAIGYPYTEIAAAVGMHERPIGAIARGDYDKVRVATAEAVLALYARLSMVPGTSSLARTIAGRNGWVPPLAWDEDVIDDPNAEPELAVDGAPAWFVLAENAVELQDLGLTREQSAARLGATVEELRSALNRYRSGSYATEGWKCNRPGCPRARETRGMCVAHYRQQLRAEAAASRRMAVAA